MSVYCFCKKYKLTRWEMFDLTPSPQESKRGAANCFTCPSCGTNLRITLKARLLYAVALLLSVFGGLGVVYIGLVHILPEVSLSARVADNIAASIMAAYFFASLPLLWFVIWPQIIELEEWRPFDTGSKQQWMLSLIVLFCLVLLVGAIGFFVYFWR